MTLATLQPPALTPSSGSLEDLVRPLLAVLEELTGMESSYLTRIDAQTSRQSIWFARNRGHLHLQEGLTLPWEESLFKRALDSGRAACADVAATWPEATPALALGIRSYVGVPIQLDEGQLFGTLCAASSQPQPTSDETIRVIRLLASLVERQLGAERRASLAEQSLTRMAIAAQVGELCVHAADLGTVLTGIARRLTTLPAWRQAWPFLIDDAGTASGLDQGSPQELLSAVIQIVGDRLLDDHNEHYSPVLSEEQLAAVADKLHPATGLAISTCLALLPATSSAGLQGGLLLLGDENALLETRDRQLLMTCSNFLSLLAGRLHQQRILEASNQSLSLEAGQDALTGLPNRRQLLKTLERTLEAARHDGRQVYVAFVDLDNFKRINDAHGHEAGDLFLISIARRLLKGLRADDIVGRFGGDEFLVVSTAAAGRAVSEVSRNLMERIDLALVGQHELGSKSIDYQGASIGIAAWQGETPAELLRQADQAMYRVKRQRSGQSAKRRRRR